MFICFLTLNTNQQTAGKGVNFVVFTKKLICFTLSIFLLLPKVKK